MHLAVTSLQWKHISQYSSVFYHSSIESYKEERSDLPNPQFVKRAGNRVQNSKNKCTPLVKHLPILFIL